MKLLRSIAEGQHSGFRVDTIPGLIRPFYLALTWAAGTVVYLYYALCRLTSRISIEGSGNHDLSQHSIFASGMKTGCPTLSCFCDTVPRTR